MVLIVVWLWYMCGEEHVWDRQTEGKKGGKASATLQLCQYCVACRWRTHPVVVIVVWLWYVCGEEHVRDQQTEG